MKVEVGDWVLCNVHKKEFIGEVAGMNGFPLYYILKRMRGQSTVVFIDEIREVRPPQVKG